MDMLFEESKARHKFYGVEQLAALWDGIPQEEMEQFFEKGGEWIEAGVYSHPKSPDIELRCRIIIGVIEEEKIQYKNDSYKIFGSSPEDIDPTVSIPYHDHTTISLYNFIEFIVENYPNQIPESMRVLADHIQKKKIEMKPEKVNPKRENSMLKIIAAFAEYTMGTKKSSDADVFKNMSTFHKAMNELYGINYKTLTNILDDAKRLEKKK